MKLRVDSLDQLPEAAEEFLRQIGENKKFAFRGEMGAGKTTFIKEVLKKLDVEDPGRSPTFSIINEYFSVTYGSVYHFDFYRIEDESEALDIGVEEIFDSDSFCFIEWPERIENLLPENCVYVSITDELDYRQIEVLE